MLSNSVASMAALHWERRSCRLAYLMITTFMLHGVRVSESGRLCAPRLVVAGAAQTGIVAFVWS